MLVTILIFLVLIAVLILVHEAGHFFAARRAGIKVEEFGFGFPPRIIGFKRGETIYSLNWIPLGGFVKIYGEEGLPSDSASVATLASPELSAERGSAKGAASAKEGRGADDKRCFVNRSAAVRAGVLVAGVAMNMVLAMALFSVGHMIGLPTIVEDGTKTSALTGARIQVVETAKDSPAAQELAVGDTIMRIDGRTFERTEDIQNYVRGHRGQELTFEILHDNAQKTVRLTPRVEPPPNQGPLGIAMVKTAIEKLPWYRAIPEGIQDAFVLAWYILKSLGHLVADFFSTGKIAGDVAGPVGIAVLTGRVAKLGIAHLLQFAGAISVNLALINVFPIPALDGGRLLFIVLEKIKGRPVRRVLEQKIHQLSFTLLLLLMLFITARDIVKLF